VSAAAAAGVLCGKRSPPSACLVGACAPPNDCRLVSEISESSEPMALAPSMYCLYRSLIIFTLYWKVGKDLTSANVNNISGERRGRARGRGSKGFTRVLLHSGACV
jgi:hypothetical protein